MAAIYGHHKDLIWAALVVGVGWIADAFFGVLAQDPKIYGLSFLVLAFYARLLMISDAIRQRE